MTPTDYPFDLPQQVIDTYRRLSTQDLGTGTSGNVSMRSPDGIVITPSAIAPDQIEAEDLVTVDVQGKRLAGQGQPSSEWRMHCDIYASIPDATAVVHAHPPHATALACLRRDIPAFHYMVAVAGGDSIRCARYAGFGSQALSDAMLDALQDRKACLLANHGIIAWHSSLEKALDLAVEVETLARQYLNALAIAEPTLLSGEEMRDVHARFKAYRAGEAIT